MKTARSVPCLAVMAAGLVAGTAAAQQPGMAVAEGGRPTLDRFGNRNYQLRTDVGDGIGYSQGYQTFGIFQPFMVQPDQSLLFINPRGILTFEGNFVGSLGGGMRWMDPQSERIWGMGGWFDQDTTGDFDYGQWGVSLESLGNILDVRANIYLPKDSSANVLTQQLDGRVFFVGNNIGLGRETLYQSPLSGGDFEIGGAFIPGFSDAGIRAYAGGYYMEGDVAGSGYGVKARAEALVTQNLIVNVGWSNDPFFDTNLTAAVTWYLGTGESPMWFQRMPQTTRLYQQMERNYRNMVLTHEVVDFVNALRAGGTGGSGGAIGTPIEVVHVNNLAPAGGDGTFERPLNTLPGTTGSNVDIIFVNRGDGTTLNMDGGIVLNDWQRLLGEGFPHQFTSTQGTFLLPGFTPGPFPSITNLAGDAVTLANHNEVAGFNIPGAGGRAIAGGDVEDFNLHDLNITDSVLEGIQITNASGTGLINDVTVTDAGSTGIDIASTGSSVLDLTTRRNLVTGSLGSGLQVTGSDSSNVTLDSRFDEYSGNVGDGVTLIAENSATVDALLRDFTARTNTGNGVTALGRDSGNITTSIVGNALTPNPTTEISSNQGNGVQMRLIDNSIGNLSVLNSSIQGNSLDGIRLDLEDNSIADLLVDGNTITGGSVGLTFFLDGNTFLQPFAITNSTAAGGPNLVDFTLTLADPFVFDTANGASVPFAPVPPTDVLTGLDEVNGSTNPPGWVVADNSQTLNMTFTDFDPAETFQWNIDLDPDPLFDGAVFGDELIGSTVTATYSDGQILAGSLVAVAGNPDASTFVATSGLGGGNGVHVVGSGAAVLNSAAITNNDISRSGLNGVLIEMSDASSVGATGIDITSNTITDNGQAGPGDGVLVQVSNSAQIASGLLRIDLNDINNNAGNGVGLQAADAALLNAILTGNTITQNTGAGVAVAATPAPTVNVDILGQNPVSGVTGQNIISNNDAGGVLFDMIGATTTAVISDAIIADNGGIGIGTTAIDGVLNLQVGGPLATDKVLLDGNAGAGIAYTLLDTASGTLLIQGNEIIGTTALAGSPIYTGQAIDIRLSDSGVPATATATLSGAQIFDNIIGSETNAANGNAGSGLNFFADNATTLDGLLFDNNVVANNGGDGLTFDRRNTATVNGVLITNNLIDSNGDDGIEINARNAGNDVNDYLIAGNQILNAPDVGVLLNVEADAQLLVDLLSNEITGSGSHGVHLTETVNTPSDGRFITGDFEGNDISNNGGAGVQVDAVVNSLDIGTNTQGNTITDNGGAGVVINAPGDGSISDNLITRNAGGGIDINITSSVANATNDWAINLNAIVNNLGDGIEILNNQPAFPTGEPGLLVTVTDNTIRRNTGRGIDILNRVGPSGEAELAVSIAGNTISENTLEGVYLVNTASTTQGQTAAATAPLLADGGIATNPRTTFSLTDNTITGNGTGSAFAATGLVVRVGTSDGGRGITDAGGFFSSNRGGVGATVTGNTFSGNFGDDLFYQSFTSTIDPTTGTTWDATTFDTTGYQSDPLARLDLTQNGNIFDAAAVNNAGAFYNNDDPVFKSRDVTQTDPGPFFAGTRERNAQRLAFRGVGPDQLAPFTPGGASDLFLYPGLGRSTFRVLGTFDAGAGFIFDTTPYTDANDGNGVFSPTGAGFEIEATRYGWTLVP